MSSPALHNPPLAVAPPRRGLLAGLTRWFDAMPHPAIACEIATGHVAAARYSRRSAGLEDYAVEPLPTS